MEKWLDFAAGVAGGMAGISIGQPLDVARVRLQTQTIGHSVHYSGLFNCISQILRTEGVRAFYRGIVPPLLSVAGTNALLFGCYGNMCRMMQKDPMVPLTLSEIGICGSTVGIVCCVVNSPSELIKIRMQVYLTKEELDAGGASTRVTAQRLMRHGGLRSLYHGFGITVIRDAPSFGIYFMAYEGLCRHFHIAGGSIGLREFLLLNVAGGVAGMVSWASIYPIDVVKSCFQAQPSSAAQSYMACARALHRAGGWRAFFLGLGATMARAFPLNAATFSVYELALHHLERIHL